MIEKTLVLVKPDGVQRSLVGEIIQRFERVGLKIVAMKMVRMDPEFSRKHYEAHVEKDFYPRLEKFMLSGPVVAMVLEDLHAVETVRKIVGATEPSKATPGTIRGDYAMHSYEYTQSKEMAVRNLVHASGDPEDAQKEVALWFGQDQQAYPLSADEHLL